MDDALEKLRKCRIGVLAGGLSSEREISLKSGRAVVASLIRTGFDVVFIDVKSDSFTEEIEAAGVDIAFIALHGKFGEDGGVQRILEAKGIKYTGSGPEASRLAMDKIASKKIFKEADIPVAKHSILTKESDLFRENIEIPCVVKPGSEGSSIGLSIVADRKELDRAVREAFSFGKKVMIEQFISGREITVGVLGDKALPIVEIITEKGVYDFDAKYSSSATRYIVPAEIGEISYQDAQNLGLKAHRILGCRGFSRVDMLISGFGEISVLEVNTIPGLTERSLLPMAAKQAGLDFDQLCVRMLLEAIE